MRIGIDGSCWWSLRGFGRFTRGLLSAMFDTPGEHHYVLFIDRPPEPEMLRAGVEVVQVPQSRPTTEAAVADGHRSLRDLWRFRRAIAGHSLDLFYFPAVYSWYPTPAGLPVVLTLHDAIAEHFPALIFPHWQGRLLWATKMRLARWQAQRLVTVSQAARAEILEYMPVDAADIDVITEAAEPMFQPLRDAGRLSAMRRKYHLPPDARYLLYVGGLAPHKNIDGLIAGLRLAAERGAIGDLRLVLVGDPQGDGFHSNYQQLLDGLGQDQDFRGRIHFTGYVSDADLVALYSAALAVVMPSFSEGFGLPAIEALACHVPVLASNTASLPEVVGDAGLYFDPHSHASIADAIERIAGQPALRARLRVEAIQRSRSFSWQRAADLLEHCFQGVTAGPR